MPSRNFAESLDHFVVPVDDLVVAEEFYVRVFGGIITKRNGLERAPTQDAAPCRIRSFRSAANAWVFICRAMTAPDPAVPRGLPTYSFTTTRAGLAEVAKELKELGTGFEGPLKNAYPFAEQCLFF